MDIPVEIWISAAIQDGNPDSIQISSHPDGIRISKVISGSAVIQDGIWISEVIQDGIQISEVTQDGIRISKVIRDGIRISDVMWDVIRISEVIWDGLPEQRSHPGWDPDQ